MPLSGRGRDVDRGSELKQELHKAWRDPSTQNISKHFRILSHGSHMISWCYGRYGSLSLALLEFSNSSTSRTCQIWPGQAGDAVSAISAISVTSKSMSKAGDSRDCSGRFLHICTELQKNCDVRHEIRGRLAAEPVTTGARQAASGATILQRNWQHVLKS